jgi:hypothetical protein
MTKNEMTRRAALGAVGAAAATALAGAAAANAADGGKPGKLKLFEKVDPSVVKKGAPPLVFQPVPDGHITFETQEELKAWEDEIRTRLGVKLKGTLGTASESCSGGCSDDCD